MQPLPSLRYLRATSITVLAVAVVPLLFLAIALFDFSSPDWDSSGDSGVAQGLLVSCVAAALATSFAAVAFPTAAYYLHSRGRYSGTNLFWFLAVLLAVFSFVTALVVSQFLGSLHGFVRLWPILFVVAGALTLPFVWLWTRLAR